MGSEKVVTSDPSFLRQSWSAEALELARQAKGSNALRLAPLIRRLQRATGKRKRDCASLVIRQLEQNPRPAAWSEDEIDQLRELALSLSMEEIALKLGRSTEAVRGICRRKGIRLRELRCDFFSVTSLATLMHVRKQEICLWVEQGWLEATRMEQNHSVTYKISPEALQKCLRTHRDKLRKRNIRSAAIFQAFREYCYVPKHTVGEQLLQVREAKREQAAYELFTEK
jgi:hypothetical protein